MTAANASVYGTRIKAFPQSAKEREGSEAWESHCERQRRRGSERSAKPKCVWSCVRASVGTCPWQQS